MTKICCITVKIVPNSTNVDTLETFTDIYYVFWGCNADRYTGIKVILTLDMQW